jgi:hypothetical protein
MKGRGQQEVMAMSRSAPQDFQVVKLSRGGVRATLICFIEQTGRSTANAFGSLSVQGTRSSGSARKA